LSAVRGFPAWAQAFDPDIQVPPAGLLPMRATRATPYLYSEDQIGALMNAAATLVPALRAVTFQTLIGLLAVTGMRAGEAIRADVQDLDLDAAILRSGAPSSESLASSRCTPRWSRNCAHT